MPRRSETRLTDTDLRKLRAGIGESERIVFDRDEPGFGVRIAPKRRGPDGQMQDGAATFLIQYMRGAKTRRFALKGYTKTADARVEAKGLLSRIRKDSTFDPSMERRIERRAAAEADAGLFEVVAKNFLAAVPASLR